MSLLRLPAGLFSAQLIPTLAALLKKHGYGVKDLGGFAAASGPGSFTGLRVGLSAIKGLAETLHKPIATVSVLEALASLADREGKIAAAMEREEKKFFLAFIKSMRTKVQAGETECGKLHAAIGRTLR